MKKSRLLLISAVLTLASASCGNDGDGDSGIQVRNFANTGCKSVETRGEDGLPWPEYIEYKSMEDGYLSIKHVNTMFNCFPGELRMSATVSDNEIRIVEEDYHETDNYIRATCDCPYDLYCEVGPLAEGTYTVIIYKYSYQYEQARFTISHSKGLDGKFSISESEPTTTADTQQADACKMLVNGRTWNYMSVYFNYPAPDTVYHSITIDGPVEFDGKQCYKYGEDNANHYFYEEGSKVYAYKWVTNSTTGQVKLSWKEDFDFGIESGYKETYSDGEITIVLRECKSVDDIVVNGVKRRRLDFGDDIWVEGIGSSKSGIYAEWGTVSGSLMSSKLLSVYDGEKCIFTAADFTAK